jgi:hypothetical protein
MGRGKQVGEEAHLRPCRRRSKTRTFHLQGCMGVCIVCIAAHQGADIPSVGKFTELFCILY